MDEAPDLRAGKIIPSNRVWQAALSTRAAPRKRRL